MARKTGVSVAGGALMCDRIGVANMQMGCLLDRNLHVGRKPLKPWKNRPSEAAVLAGPDMHLILGQRAVERGKLAVPKGRAVAWWHGPTSRSGRRVSIHNRMCGRCRTASLAEGEPVGHSFGAMTGRWR
jgi:hypothetical protein